MNWPINLVFILVTAKRAMTRGSNLSWHTNQLVRLVPALYQNRHADTLLTTFFINNSQGFRGHSYQQVLSEAVFRLYKVMNKAVLEQRQTGFCEFLPTWGYLLILLP